MQVNQKLLELAQRRLEQLKSAFVPTQPDPSQMPQGQMDPAMMQQAGADPAAMGADPSAAMQDPAMMGGGMPPADPNAGMPAPATGQGNVTPPPGLTPAAPTAAGVPQQPGGKPKFDPLMLDYRIYNLQQMVTAIANALGVTVPAGALIMPPGGAGAPPAEAALPGGSQDPSAQQQPQQQQGIQPMPSAGEAAAGPMAQMGKTAAELEDEERQFQDLLFDINHDPSVPKAARNEDSDFFKFADTAVTRDTPDLKPLSDTSEALLALLRTPISES